MVETYSRMGLVLSLHVVSIVSFCSPPPVVDVSAFSICIVLHAYVAVFFLHIYMVLIVSSQLSCSW